MAQTSKHSKTSAEVGRIRTIEGMNRYRTRGWLRAHAPGAFSRLFPKGPHDCGNHVWYRSDESTWRCYYCEPGVTHESPWTERESARYALAALDVLDGLPADSGEIARLLQDAGTSMLREAEALKTGAGQPEPD